jgi:hypothetical protein
MGREVITGLIVGQYMSHHQIDCRWENSPLDWSSVGKSYSWIYRWQEEKSPPDWSSVGKSHHRIDRWWEDLSPHIESRYLCTETKHPRPDLKPVRWGNTWEDDACGDMCVGWFWGGASSDVLVARSQLGLTKTKDYM